MCSMGLQGQWSQAGPRRAGGGLRYTGRAGCHRLILADLGWVTWAARGRPGREFFILLMLVMCATREKGTGNAPKIWLLVWAVRIQV